MTPNEPLTEKGQTREVRCEATVMIDVSPSAPADWLSRVTTSDFPYARWNGEPMSEADGLKMLADNALRNGALETPPASTAGVTSTLAT